ncbi:MAG: hypothetical protein E7326_04960 [Clostridiales bacterium]|nr:hypothetical protein [Clostridiales bacterium]
MMERLRLRLRRMDYTPLLLIAAMALMWALLHAATGIRPFGYTGYNTYTLQALAWRQGQTFIENRPHLELAVFNGQYYISFPPVPSVVLYPLTFLFGAKTPDNLLVKLYALGACLLMYAAFRRAAYKKWNAACAAFLFTFASSLLPLTLEGAVWYHAQVLAFFLTVSAICLMTLDKPTPALFLYALAVGCRPFNVLHGLPLMLIYVSLCRRAGESYGYIAKRMWKGIVLGLMVAAAYAAYNFVRFGNPLEFGHNYLPEFSFQGGKQFALSHVVKNVKEFFFRAPFYVQDGAIHLQKFGFSLFIACPVLTLLIVWFVQDLWQKRMTGEKALIFVCFLAHLFLLLLHRTFGGFQFGARYCADLIPYAFFYQLMRAERKEMPVWQLCVLGVLFLFTLCGSMLIYL